MAVPQRDYKAKVEAMVPNASVLYVNENGEVVAVEEFYDPGLDEESWYAKEEKKAGRWRGPHLIYGVGTPK